MTRLLRGGGVIAICLSTFPALAQDLETPEMVAAEAARAKAGKLASEALRSIERYGRAEPVRIDARWARKRAMQRLSRKVAVTPRARPPLKDLPDEYERLKKFREAILNRLRRLDPGKYPRPKPVVRVEPKQVLKIVDVVDLSYTPKDYVTPNVGLGANLDASGAVEVLADTPSEGGGTGVDSDKLIELLDKHLEDEEGSIELSKGKLLIRKSPQSMAKVLRLLEQLRQKQNGLVELEIRVYRMPPRVFETLRSVSSALDVKSEVALTKAVGAGTVKLLSRHRMVAHDGQRVHVRRGASRSLVGDLSVDQTGVTPVVNPEVSVINEGLVVEVRPVVDRAEKRVVLDVSISVGRLAKPIETRKLSGVEIDLPEMQVARTSSTAIVPLGRGALLGGVFKHATGGGPLTHVIYVRPRLVQRPKKR